MGQRKKQTVIKEQGSRIEGGAALHPANSLKPYVIVFIASTCGMIIEIVAARALAPTIGVSLYTWTSIIGIVLAGISIGNYLGGRLADRFPSPTTLGFILLAGGIFSLAVLPLLKIVPEASKALPYIPRIIFLTTILFFLPSLILGMVTPVVIKLRLMNLANTGNVVGKIYAISTAGSIFGTFITGFVLIQLIGTRAVILLVAVLLVLMALAFGNLWRAKKPAVICLVLFLGIGGFAIPGNTTEHDVVIESNYYRIRIYDTVESGHKVKAIKLDAMDHGYNSLEDPTLLNHDYLKVFADIAAYTARQNPAPRSLFVGGGAYTLPRYLEAVYPESTLEVIEIDPEVTRVAFEYLGLSPDTRIVTYNEDGRMAVAKLPEGKYDLVFGDAFNNYSIPFQLTTNEFNQQIKALLKSNGIYASMVIDKLRSGSFLRAYVNTLRQTFPHVYLIPGGLNWEGDNRETHVVVGSLQPLSSTALSEASARAGLDYPAIFTPEDTLASWLNARKNIFLTDDYAPADNLVADLYVEGNSLRKAEELSNEGMALLNQGKVKEAIASFDQAIRLDPNLAIAYNDRGTAYFSLGQFLRATQDFDQAIRLVRNDPGLAASAYRNRGVVYFYLGQFQQAVQDCDEAIRLDARNAGAYACRAAAYTSLNMDAKAQQDFDQAVKLGYDPVSLRAEMEKAKKARQR